MGDARGVPFRKIHDTYLPAARENAETAKETYDQDEQDFNQAYLQYTQDRDEYQRYYDAVYENVDFVKEARDLAENSMNATSLLNDALIETASCEPSTICCQKPEVGCSFYWLFAI